MTWFWEHEEMMDKPKKWSEMVFVLMGAVLKNIKCFGRFYLCLYLKCAKLIAVGKYVFFLFQFVRIGKNIPEKVLQVSKHIENKYK